MSGCLTGFAGDVFEVALPIGMVMALTSGPTHAAIVCGTSYTLTSRPRSAGI